MVLKIFDGSLESIPPDGIDEVARKEPDDRKANVEKLPDGSPFGKVQQSPPPPMSQRRVSLFTAPTRVHQALRLERKEKLSNFEIIFVIYLFEGNHTVYVRKH